MSSTRRAGGWAWVPCERFHGGLSQELCLVGTFPQLEYPRRWPPNVHVVGPLMWEPPFDSIDPPPGDEPLVLVAPSTAQDPDHRLLRAALSGLGDAPVRVLATWNRRPLPSPVKVAANTRLVEWLSYSQTIPGCALVICHAGHGTLVRALASGCPVLAVPHAGDMAENAARLDWAGAGVRLPWPLLGPRTLRLATLRALGRPELSDRGRASWRPGPAPRAGRPARPTWCRSWRSGVAPGAHESDDIGVLALEHVDRLPVTRAQLHHDAPVGDLERVPAGAVLLPALEILDPRRWANGHPGLSA